MEKLIEKTDNLINKIDSLETIQELKRLNRIIISNHELLKMLEKYRLTQDLKIKEKILSNKVFSEYKHTEMELNLIILEINKKLKEINNRSNCQK